MFKDVSKILFGTLGAAIVVSAVTTGACKIIDAKNRKNAPIDCTYTTKERTEKAAK